MGGCSPSRVTTQSGRAEERVIQTFQMKEDELSKAHERLQKVKNANELIRNLSLERKSIQHSPDFSDVDCRHVLKPFLPPTPNFTCDGCQRRAPQTTNLFGCRECNFDLCFTCYCAANLYFHPPALPSCPHTLTEFSTPRDDFYCSECNNQVIKGVKFHGCRICNFDLCAACHTKRVLTNLRTKIGLLKKEEAKQTATTSSTAPCSHTLKEFKTPNSSFLCDECRAHIGERDTLFGCRKCNFDLCPPCYDKSSYKPSMIHSASPCKHPLVPFRTPNALSSCQTCKIALASDTKVYGCQTCYFYYCSRCFIKTMASKVDKIPLNSQQQQAKKGFEEKKKSEEWKKSVVFEEKKSVVFEEKKSVVFEEKKSVVFEEKKHHSFKRPVEPTKATFASQQTKFSPLVLEKQKPPPVLTSNKTTSSPPKCTHPLTVFLTPNPNFHCDKCLVRVEENTPMSGCRLCKFDLCVKCRQPPPLFTTPLKTYTVPLKSFSTPPPPPPPIVVIEMTPPKVVPPPPERKVLLAKWESELKVLDEKLAESWQSFLKHLYAKHPPGNGKTILEGELNDKTKKRALLTGIKHYHPDKVDQDDYVLKIFREEITKRLNKCNKTVKT